MKMTRHPLDGASNRRPCDVLSFVNYNDAGKRTFWKPERAHDYLTDCRSGAKIAKELCNYMIDNDDPTLLRAVIADIIKSGECCSVETGFFNELAMTIIQAYR